MKAWAHDRYGGPEVLELRELPDPVPGPSEVLVAVHATSVNPVDWKIRVGKQRAINPQRFPAIPGMDVSGEVVALGPGVQGFSVGDAVFSSPSHRRPGSFAELISIRASELAPKPASLSHAEAASLPLAALTAWDCLVNAAKLKPGERLFVQAGAGGVGSIAIQLGKSLGATVTTTCSEANADFVRSLGADRVIDYRKTAWHEALEPQDVILECLGPDEVLRALGCLKPGGRVASINSGLGPAVARWGPWLAVLPLVFGLLRHSLAGRLRGKRVHHVVRKADGAALAEIGALVQTGAIHPQVGTVLPFDQAPESHRLSETGHVRGKVVVQVRQ